MRTLQLMFFSMICSVLLASCGSDTESEIRNTGTGFDAPYSLAAIPWGTSVEDVRRSVPRLVDHKSSDAIGLRDRSVVWGGVKLSGVLWFDADGFKSINLMPQAEGAKGMEAAANTLRRRLEEIHGEPSEAESRDSGYLRTEWQLEATKIQLAYIPGGERINAHAILAYARSPNRADQDAGDQLPARQDSKSK